MSSVDDAEDTVIQPFIAIAHNTQKFSQIDCPKTTSSIVIIIENKAPDMIRQREVVLLCGDGYKPAEIAKILGISPANVYKILQRARKALETAMKGEL